MAGERRRPGQGRPVRPVRSPARAGGDPLRSARGVRNPAPVRAVSDGVRSASRPASARRAAATGAAKRTRAPEPGGGRFTGRATALVLVLVVLLLAYAYPMRIYLNQQAQIAALESSQAAQRLRIQQKQGQVAKWNDTEYIIAMAHKRLQMVLPGDVAYLVTDPSVAAQNPGGDPDAGKAKDTGPWYGQLWSSVQAADKPRTGP